MRKDCGEKCVFLKPLPSPLGTVSESAVRKRVETWPFRSLFPEILLAPVRNTIMNAFTTEMQQQASKTTRRRQAGRKRIVEPTSRWQQSRPVQRLHNHVSVVQLIRQECPDVATIAGDDQRLLVPGKGHASHNMPHLQAQNCTDSNNGDTETTAKSMILLLTPSLPSVFTVNRARSICGTAATQITIHNSQQRCHCHETPITMKSMHITVAPRE